MTADTVHCQARGYLNSTHSPLIAMACCTSLVLLHCSKACVGRPAELPTIASVSAAIEDSHGGTIIEGEHGWLID